MLAKANIELPSMEAGWRPADFPSVLAAANKHQLACIGGQFQFRGTIGTAEMYWLSADSSPKTEKESWETYAARANAEVMAGFEEIVRETDFLREARKWIHIVQAMDSGRVSNPTEHLFFIAYFNAQVTKPNSQC